MMRVSWSSDDNNSNDNDGRGNDDAFDEGNGDKHGYDDATAAVAGAAAYDLE